MYLSHPDLVKALLDQFLMDCLVLIVVFELPGDSLHLNPFLQRVDHLLLLLVDRPQGLFFLLQTLEQLPHLHVPVLENRLQFVALFAGQPLVLPNVEHSLDLPQFEFQLLESLQHLYKLPVPELSHYN